MGWSMEVIVAGELPNAEHIQACTSYVVTSENMQGSWHRFCLGQEDMKGLSV